ncbi:MAG: NAD(P)-dependent methylenetetrahydromethanopterin dehydrogenase [Gammaproteobacteria bacterium]
MSKNILYMLAPGSNISPFDVTLAADSGYDLVLPLTGVQNNDVIPTIQDAIFCRPPGRFQNTGIFLGGRDVNLAADMIESAKKAMVGPFQVGVFADPNGAYTTSASVVALVKKVLLQKTGKGFEGLNVAVLGGGPVGLCSAVLAAKEGANPYLCQLTADENIKAAKRFCKRYDIEVPWVSAETHKDKISAIAEADVILCAVKAGIRILDTEVLNHASKLIVAADTNAVPPSGVEGIDSQDNGVTVETETGSFSGIGPLAIGNLKYKVQYGLFEQMQNSKKASMIDFEDAYHYAESLFKPVVETSEELEEEFA